MMDARCLPRAALPVLKLLAGVARAQLPFESFT